MGPKDLIGKRSLAAAQFRLNNKYPVGTLLATKAGYYGLGVHRTLNMQLEPLYGQAAWREYVRSTQAAMATVHTGTGSIGYTVQDVSAFLSQCYIIHLQFAELRHAIKMLDWSCPTTLEAMKDFWASGEAAAIEARAIKSQICNRLNAYADTFYTTYPFRIPAYIRFIDELLSNTYRDDNNERTNYIYFNLFDKPWDLIGTVGTPSTFFKIAFDRLDAWLNPANPLFATSSVFGQLGANKLPLIIGDYRQVFGMAANQSIPLLFPQDPVDVLYNQDLINALNASPTGDMEWNYVAGSAWNRFSAEMANTGFAGWLVTRPQLSSWANDAFLKWEFGPSWNTSVSGGPLAAAPGQNAIWNAMANDVNNFVWDIPVYHGFDGETILSDMAFTELTNVKTWTLDSAGERVYDPTPTFSQNHYFDITRSGLFGIYITDTVSYVLYTSGQWNLNYATGYNVWHIPSFIGSNPGRPPAPIVSSIASRAAYGNILNARQMAYTMDAVTNWDFIYVAADNVYQVVTDEDVDEWTILPFVDLIANFGATAKGMFDSDTAINAQSNRVQDVMLDTRRSGYTAKKSAGWAKEQRGRGNYGKGKKPKR